MDDKELRKKAYKVIKNYCWECAEDDSVHRKGFHSNQVNEWVALFHSEMAKKGESLKKPYLLKLAKPFSTKTRDIREDEEVAYKPLTNPSNKSVKSTTVTRNMVVGTSATTTYPPQDKQEWVERLELARIRCSEVVDLDRKPPVIYAAMRCRTALDELDDLDKLHRDLLDKQKEEMLREVEDMRIIRTQGNNDVYHDEIEQYNSAIDDVLSALSLLKEVKV